MTREEAIGLCRYVHAATPAQRLDEYTPQAWADILADEPAPAGSVPQPRTFDECRRAVVAIKRRQPFVDCSDIVAEVRAARAAAAERTHSEAVIGPARASREALTDSRPLHSEIRALIAGAAEHGPEFAAIIGAAGDACAANRAVVLRHPDLAARLCEPPLDYARPDQWTGYVPPALCSGTINDSPRRQALLALVSEAEHLDRAGRHP